jgi:hypothetical protein
MAAIRPSLAILFNFGRRNSPPSLPVKTGGLQRSWWGLVARFVGKSIKPTEQVIHSG